MVKIPKIFILIFFLFCSNSLSSENNIVFLDMDFILTNSLAGKNINEQIDKLNESKITELNKIEELIREKDKEISNQKNILSEDQLKIKVENLKNEVQDYQSKVQSNRKEISDLRIKATGKLLTNLKPILAEYAKEKSISLILQKKDVIIGKNNLNITNEIMEIFNGKVKKIDLN